MKSFHKLFFALLLVGTFSCQDQLDVKNPNEPTTDVLASEKGFLKYVLGGTYINGFVDIKTVAFADGTLGPLLANGFHDIMADNLAAEAANVFLNQIGAPEKVILDDNSVVMNPNSPTKQTAMLKQNNLNASAGQNPLFYEWAYMYALNRASNFVLENAETVTYVGDAATKIKVLKAWAYWWKGYAYSRIGSLYYAGLIVNDTKGTNGNYKTSAQIIAEAENNFSKAEDILKTLTFNAPYQDVLGKIIPEFNQVGKGGILTPDMWIRNINTMRARNLLVNKRVSAMTSADWDAVLALTNNGIKSTDFVFTCRSNANGDVMSPFVGSVAAKATGDPASGATYKISERLIQSFQPGDQRFENNFEELDEPWIGNVDRGNSFNTRWQLVDGGNDLSGVIVYSNRDAGAYELFLAGSYEENELMKAEANIYKGNIASGLSSIHQVRTYQGAGLAAPGALTQAQAVAQLRSERKVALLFRNVAFYDARRYGILDPISAGGGVTGVVVVDGTGHLNTNATIEYNFLDYWHVPDNELAYNKPADGSAPVVNPRPN